MDYYSRRDRARRMRDYRNPYGSRGGYVSSDRSRYRDTRHDMRRNDYARMSNEYNNRPEPYMDYGDYNDYGENDDYKDDLKKWIRKLKKNDRYGMTFDQVISEAKKYGVKFDEYDEEEFYATFLMMISDYGDVTSDPTMFVKMAKAFLEDDDINMSGSDKLCAYMYEIAMA